jgi:hypothetical protein
VAKVPTVKVPVTIDASGVEGQLRRTERRIKDSQARLAKARAAATPTLGALGGGALGGIAGGVGQLGLGGGAVGAGLMAAAAPLLLANRTIEAFAEATKGSTEALAKFRETGINATGINSALLETLSALETQAQRAATGPTLFQSFLGGTGGEANALLTAAETMKEGSLGLAAAFGALTSGKTLQEAFLALQLPTAGEARSEQLRKEMDVMALQRRPQDAGYLDVLGTTNPLLQGVTQLIRALT